MLDVNGIKLFRITHLENIPHILQNGITHSHSAFRNQKFVSIGDSSLIDTRSTSTLPNGRTLGEYIPFYFGVRMPMLYVIQNGYNGVKAVSPTNIVYCVSSVGAILQLGLDFVFTDGHAASGLSNFYFPNDIQKIQALIDPKAINSKYWIDERDLDLKRRKEAEFLVLSDIQAGGILIYIVYNEEARARLVQINGYNGEKVIINPNCYF